MNAFGILCIITAITTFGIALFCIYKGRTNLSARALAGIAISGGTWALAGSVFSNIQISSYNLALFWWQVGYTGVIFTIVFFVHFIISYLKLNKRWFILLTYLLGFIFLFLNWYKNSYLFLGNLSFSFNQFYWHDWLKHKGLIWFIFYILFYWILLGYSFLLLIKTYRTSTGILRNQLKYFILGSIIGFVGAELQFLVDFGVNIYPHYIILISLSPALYAYAIVKHQLLDITVAITRATIFALVYGFTFGLPFAVFFLWKQQVHYLYTTYPWAIPASLMGYAALATISPFIYIRLERKVYYAIFGDYSSKLRVLTETSREVIERGFENALDLAGTIPDHIISFYDKIMRQKVNHAFYLLREGGYFTLHHGNMKCDKHEEGMKFGHGNAVVRWFTETREQLVQKKLIKGKDNNILEKEALTSLIAEVSQKAKFEEYKEELKDLQKDMELLESVIFLPSYYKDELMGILALGEKKGGFYRPEEMETLRKLAENAAMVFKGSQLTASVVEADNIKKLGRAKSEFFANVSHELRTPLTNIILPIQNILEKIGHKITPENREEKEAMLRNAHKLLKRINEILDISKLESGKMQIRVSLRDINSILEDIVAVSSIGAKEMEIDLLFTPDNTVSQIYVDTEKIEKVFSNLVSNALKFTNPKGKVEIKTKEEDDHIEVSVSDTGIGIAHDDLPSIFERFRQVDSSSSRKYEGTGIGLSLVKELVELHHGSIEVSSELGKGTTFTARLLKGKDHFKQEEIIEELKEPEILTNAGFVERRTKDRRKTDRRGEDRRKMSTMDKVSIDLLQLQFSDLSQGQDVTLEAAHGQTKAPEKEKTLLVVDNNKDLANNIARCFSQEYKIHLAYNGKQALDLIDKELPALVISDVMMPEMDGYELCQKIKGTDRTRHIPVVLLTAKAAVEDKIAGLKYGADDYLAKPFNAKELIAVVDSLLSQRELQSQLNKTNQELKKALRELKETEAELVHAAKLASVGQLAAGVAHEIHNPASSVDNCFQILNKRIEKIRSNKATFDEVYPDLTKFVGLGKSSLNRIQKITDSLLGFSRKNREGLNYVDIHDGINSTLALLEHQCKNEIQVHKEYGQLEEIEVDLQQINQVFMNLFTNAIQAVKAKKESGLDCGHIWIKTAGNDKDIIITVKDDGLGIPDDVQDKIFDPFFTTKDIGKGTGLGLNISYKIIENHQGSINVTSKENEGTTFTLKLPKRSSQASPQN